MRNVKHSDEYKDWEARYIEKIRAYERMAEKREDKRRAKEGERRAQARRDRELAAQDAYDRKYIENSDPMKAKQLARGIEQLTNEGVAQVFTNQFNGRKVIGTVGQLQFEVIQFRLEHEYNAKCRWEPIKLYKACWMQSEDEAELKDFKRRKMQFMAVDKDGRDVFLAESGYVLQMAQQDFPHIKFHFTSEF